MADLEAKIEEDACDLVFNETGVVGVKFSPKGQNGWPDRIFLIPGGKPLFIEFKRPGEEPRPLQKHRIKTLRKLKYEVKVCDNPRSALRAVRSALQSARLSKAGDQVCVGARVRRPVS